MSRNEDSSIPLFLTLCCGLCAIFSSFAVFAYGWMFKDGLGPNAVESSGWTALGRFLENAGLSLLIPVPFVIAGILLYREDLRRQG